MHAADDRRVLAAARGIIGPPADDTTGGSFRGLVPQLRGRTGLTQRELATQVDVNVDSVQGWEAADNAQARRR